MGSSPSKPHFPTVPVADGSSMNGEKSPDDSPKNDRPLCGQVHQTPPANVTKSGISNTDRTGQADTRIAPVAGQRDQSLADQSSPASPLGRNCRHHLKPTSPPMGDAKMSKHLNILTAKIWNFFQNNHSENSMLKTDEDKRCVLKSMLSPAKISKSFDYLIRNMRLNTSVCCQIIACPAVLGARTFPDSSRIATVNGIPWGLMEHEVYRMSTFLFYPVDMQKSSLPLARSGFVYIGDGESDRVICFYCLKVTENWQTSDSLGGLHEVTCRRLIESENASLIDMQVLQNTNALRLGLQSGPDVSNLVQPDEGGSQLNLPVVSQTNLPVVSQTNLPVVSQTNFPVVSQTNLPVVSQTNLPVVSQPNIPVVSQTNLPVVSQPNIPAVTQPNLPEVTQPNLPVVSQTNLSVDSQTNHSVVSQRNLPEVTQPNLPEVTQPNLPEVTQPNLADVTQPNLPEVTQPNLPEVIQPNLPEITQPNLPEVTQPNIPRVSQLNLPVVSPLHLPVHSPLNLSAIAVGLELTEALSSNTGDAPSEDLGVESSEDREDLSCVGSRDMAQSHENLSWKNETDTESNTMTETECNMMTETEGNTMTETEGNKMTEAGGNTMTETEGNTMTETGGNTMTKTEGNAMSGAVSPTTNTSQLRSKPRESNNQLEVIHENEIVANLTTVEALHDTKIESKGRRHSLYSTNVRPRINRRGSV